MAFANSRIIFFMGLVLYLDRLLKLVDVKLN